MSSNLTIREERQQAYDTSNEKWIEIQRNIETIEDYAVTVKYTEDTQELLQELIDEIQEMHRTCGFCRMRDNLGKDTPQDVVGDHFTCNCPVNTACNVINLRTNKLMNKIDDIFYDNPTKDELLSCTTYAKEIINIAFAVLDDYKEAYLFVKRGR